MQASRRANSTWPVIGMLLRMLAPYVAVLVFWVGFRSAWLAILTYHAQIVFWLWRDKRSLSGLSSTRFIFFAVPSIVAGPVVFFLLPAMAGAGVGPWLASHGLSDGSLLAMVVYFGFVHPPLEQLHWAPIRQQTAWAHPLFAGYHMIVLASLLALPWLLAAFVVLCGASWMWLQLQERSQGLLVPTVSHVLADAGIVIAALLLVGCASTPSATPQAEAPTTPTATVAPSALATPSAPPTAAVPDVSDMKAEAAASAIRAAGFVPTFYAQEGWADSAADAAFRTVVESYPRSEAMWPSGGTVALGLAVPEGWTVVPSIEGLPNADEILKAYGLQAKSIPVHGPIDEDQAGFMLPYRQNPRPGTVVRKGSMVKYRFWWEKS